MNMSRTKLLAAVALLSVPMVHLAAQETNGRATRGVVSITKLAPPLYPPVAKQTRTAGDVQLGLVVRADGSVESASIVSGHPLLKQAALDSAEHSQFVCKECDNEPHTFQLTYSFQLGPTVYCAESSVPAKTNEQNESYPRVIQTENHITLYDRPVGTCDMAFKVIEKKVRSLKCLYLWNCGLADWHEEPLNAPR